MTDAAVRAALVGFLAEFSASPVGSTVLRVNSTVGFDETRCARVMGEMAAMAEAHFGGARPPTAGERARFASTAEVVRAGGFFSGPSPAGQARA
jgi:hypothetical protein